MWHLVSRARLGVRRRCRDDVRLDFAYPKLVWHPVSRARLGVRRHYRDDVRLDFLYPKLVWHPVSRLVSASVVATATTSTSTSHILSVVLVHFCFPFFLKGI